MNKKYSKDLLDKIATFEDDFDLAKKKKGHAEIFSQRVSNQIISDSKIKLKNALNKPSLRIDEENRLEFRTIQLLSKLKTEELSTAITEIIKMIKIIDNKTLNNLAPSEFKREVEAVEKNLKSIHKQICSFYTYQFLLFSVGELELLDLENSIKKVAETICKKKTQAPIFMKKHDDFFIHSSLKKIKSKTHGNKKLIIICLSLNKIYKGEGKRLNIKFLSTLSKNIILEMNKESKALKIDKIIPCKNDDYFNTIKEMQRTATWRSLAN